MKRAGNNRNIPIAIEVKIIIHIRLESPLFDVKSTTAENGMMGMMSFLIPLLQAA